MFEPIDIRKIFFAVFKAILEIIFLRVALGHITVNTSNFEGNL